MSFESFNPWVLVLLVALPTVVVATRRSLAGLGAVQRRLHLALRTLAIVVLVAALSGIALERVSTNEGTVAILVMPDEPAQSLRDFATQVRSAAGPRDDVRVVTSAGDPSTFLSRVPAQIGEGTAARVLFAGDVATIEASALAAVRRLAEGGIPVDVVVPEESSVRPVVVSVGTRGEVRSGIPFELSATIAGVGDASEVRVAFAARGVTDRALVTTRRDASRTFVAREETDAPGPHLFAVRVTKDGETAEALLPVWVHPRVRVLLLRDPEVPVDFLARALEARGMHVETAEAAAFSPAAPDWTGCDAVVLVNVTADALGEAGQETLRRYVFDGGGLVMVGGPKSFGCGGFYRTPVEKALPVTMDPLRDPPTYAMVVVLDKSWSMGDAVAGTVHKVDLVREVSIAATTPMTVNDYFGLISFDSEPHVILELRRVKDRKLITQTISTLGAFGTTNFYRAMSKAFELLKETPATYKHIVLLSDGRSSVPNLNYQTLVADMVKNRVTVSTVGVGQDCHRQLLADIAAWGRGRSVHIPTADEIPQVLLEESNRLKEILTVEVPSTVQVASSDEILAGLDVTAAPKLLGFNRVRAKESAQVLLTVGTRDEPLLCLWHYGTGRAAAFASDVSQRWAVDWIETWPGGCARIWQETLASVVRVAPTGDAGIRLTDAAGREDLCFEAVDSWGRPVTGRTLRAEITTPDDAGWATRSLALGETEPGLYRAGLASRPRPPFIVRILDETGSPCATRCVALTAPTPVAYHERMERARELARIGGGRVNPNPREIFASTPTPVPRRVDVRPVMLIAALIFVLLDLFVRRFRAVARFFRREA